MPLRQNRANRVNLIKEIENALGAKVPVYFTADAPIVSAAIAEDAALPMFDQLMAMGRQKRLALYLYSPGGQMETPWKIVSMLREFSDELHVVIPYKAHSAATMLAIGSDKIHMSRKAELGPIDPAMQVNPATGARLPDLGVEDVAAYLSFLRKRAGLSDEAAVSTLVGMLAQHLTPPLLGRIERVYSHIRLVAKNLLSLHKPPLDTTTVDRITEALTEKMYVHGHGIGRREAREIGLDVNFLAEDQEKFVWALYSSYEGTFRLRESRDPESYFPANSDLFERDNVPIACIESAASLHDFIGKIRAQRLRNVPPNPAINVNLNLQLPANINPAQLPQALQQVLNQVMQGAAQQLTGLVQSELARQSPVAGVQANFQGGYWRKAA